MNIDKKLNIVIPVTRSDGAKIYVHASPISSEVFESYFLPISKTFSAIYAEGLGILAGPRISALMLKKVSKDLGMWDGPSGVEKGLMAEIHQRTNILAVRDKGGWETIPFHEARTRGILESADLSEVENSIVFFTAASSMHRREELTDVLDGASRLWGARVTSLNCSEYGSSLQTSIETENSGATAAV